MNFRLGPPIYRIIYYLIHCTLKVEILIPVGISMADIDSEITDKLAQKKSELNEAETTENLFCMN